MTFIYRLKRTVHQNVVATKSYDIFRIGTLENFEHPIIDHGPKDRSYKYHNFFSRKDFDARFFLTINEHPKHRF